ncbi:MAG: LVIVD repeat-containing protein [Candidatus Heimdallarchaeota archaeon]
MGNKVKLVKSYLQLFILLFSFVSFVFDSPKINVNANSVIDASDEEIVNINCEELGQWDDNICTANGLFILDNSTHRSAVIISGLTITYYDISNLTSLDPIKSITYDFSLDTLEVKNLTGYLTTNSELIIFDFSNIFEPVCFTAYTFPTVVSIDFVIENDLFYCKSEPSYSYASNSTIHILNISNVLSPVLLSVFNVTNYVLSFSVENNFLYLWLYSNITIIAVNCTDPTNPQFHSSQAFAYHGNLHAHNSYLFTMTVIGSYGNFESTLSVFDFSNASNIELLCEVSIDSSIELIYSLDFSDSFLQNNCFVFVQDDFTIYNLSDSENIHEISSYSTQNKNIGLLQSIGEYESTLLLCFENSLEIVDHSNILVPKFLSSYSFGDVSYDVEIKDHYAFVADGYDGLEIIDCYNITNPVKIGSFVNGGFYYDIAISGSYVFALKEIFTIRSHFNIEYIDSIDYFLEIINVSNLTNPELISTTSIDNLDYHLSYYPDFSSQIVNDRLYIFYSCKKIFSPFSSGFGFTIFDISDVSDIQEIGSYNRVNLPDFLYSGIIHAVVDGYTVYLVNVNSDIEKISVYDLDNIHYRGNVSIDDSWEITDIDYQNNYLYLATKDQGLLIFRTDYHFESQYMIQYDISTLEDPFNGICELCVDGPFLYLGEYGAGLFVLLISNLTNIVKLGEYYDGGWVRCIDVSNNLIFVADSTDNLEIVHQSGLDYTWPPTNSGPEEPDNNPNYYFLFLLVIPAAYFVIFVFVALDVRKRLFKN